jgi:hypothetical protein
LATLAELAEDRPSDLTGAVPTDGRDDQVDDDAKDADPTAADRGSLTPTGTPGVADLRGVEAGPAVVLHRQLGLRSVTAGRADPALPGARGKRVGRNG